MPERLEITQDCLNPPLEQSIEYDKPHEECGVVGIIKRKETENIAQRIGDGLQTIQHRGQEAAGVAVGVGTDKVMALKDVGLVAIALGGNKLSGLPKGKVAVGHVRYGTIDTHTPEEAFEAAGPSLAEGSKGTIAIGLNGNLLNINDLVAEFGVDADEHVTDCSAATAAVAAAREHCDSLAEAAVMVFSKAKEAFTVVVMGEGQLIGIRDPFGFRPLMLGTYPNDGGYAMASETPALKTMGASYRREISRGEMVVCDQDGTLTSSYPFQEKPSKLCAFEFIYFSAPHAQLEGRSIKKVRTEMGRILAAEHPVEADIVVGVPESGLPAAEGYSLASGIPLVAAFAKNRYIGRTFIIPGQESREDGVERKLQVIGSEVYMKRLVLIDDSMIRGTTSKKIVAMLLEEGALEVHLRLTSAPYKWPCFYGMDTRKPEELIANQIPDLRELKEYLGVTSLAYLSLAGLRAATADAAGKLCTACMDGNYPTPIYFSEGKATNRPPK
ncbi:MAG TPA: amidophosphoribosyltransferase [Candidatus Saccharimonadales bacterium]|nr:amidophosphoribosyltransferase [Candidatus Saccharimonadales bacterium]